MSKGKNGRGGGRKTRHLDPASDVEMVDVVLPRRERYNRKKNKHSGFQTNYENDRRGRVGKGFRVTTPPQHSLTCFPSDAKPTGQRPRVTRNQTSHYLPFHYKIPVFHPSSIATSPSSPLTEGDVPWCERCIHMNRQLRDYLHDLFDTGRRAIDEWSFAMGVSPDHMDYERTRTVTIPEGFTRYSQLGFCQNCAANANARRELEGQGQGWGRGMMKNTSVPGSSENWSDSTLAAAAVAAANGSNGNIEYCQGPPPPPPPPPPGATLLVQKSLGGTFERLTPPKSTGSPTGGEALDGTVPWGATGITNNFSSIRDPFHGCWAYQAPPPPPPQTTTAQQMYLDLGQRQQQQPHTCLLEEGSDVLKCIDTNGLAQGHNNNNNNNLVAVHQ